MVTQLNLFGSEDLLQKFGCSFCRVLAYGSLLYGNIMEDPGYASFNHVLCQVGLYIRSKGYCLVFFHGVVIRFYGTNLGKAV